MRASSSGSILHQAGSQSELRSAGNSILARNFITNRDMNLDMNNAPEYIPGRLISLHNR